MSTLYVIAQWCLIASALASGFALMAQRIDQEEREREEDNRQENRP
jgi:hypothetical protein